MIHMKYQALFGFLRQWKKRICRLLQIFDGPFMDLKRFSTQNKYL